MSTLENLALACHGCNLHKAGRTTAADPLTGKQVPLFHPVQQMWSEHFRFKGCEVEGRTAVIHPPEKIKSKYGEPDKVGSEKEWLDALTKDQVILG